MNFHSNYTFFGRAATRTARVGLLLIAALVLFVASAGAGGVKTDLNGVLVSYSGAYTAYYDTNDNTITVAPTTSGGSLTITVGPAAAGYWGNYVDIYILADNITFKSINIKGTASCVPYVCGNVDYVSKFAMQSGVIGNTDFYGTDFGLGMTSVYVPATISLKYSYTTAQLFGYSNAPASEQRASLKKVRPLPPQL